jgi:hypothetical protein
MSSSYNITQENDEFVILSNKKGLTFNNKTSIGLKNNKINLSINNNSEIVSISKVIQKALSKILSTLFLSTNEDSNNYFNNLRLISTILNLIFTFNSTTTEETTPTTTEETTSQTSLKQKILDKIKKIQENVNPDTISENMEELKTDIISYFNGLYESNSSYWSMSSYNDNNETTVTLTNSQYPIVITLYSFYSDGSTNYTIKFGNTYPVTLSEYNNSSGTTVYTFNNQNEYHTINISISYNPNVSSDDNITVIISGNEGNDISVTYSYITSKGSIEIN